MKGIATLIVFLITVFGLLQFHPSVQAVAQEGVTPTLYCLGSCSVTGNPSGTMAPTGGVTGMPTTTTAPGTTNAPTINPCEETVSITRSGRKRMHKPRGNNSGLLGQLLQLIINFLNQLLQLIGGGTIPTPNPGNNNGGGNQTPCPGNTGTPAPTEIPSGNITTAPTNGAAPTGTTGSGSSPSGEAMPTGDLSTWKMIFSDDFTNDAPLGSFPGTVYGLTWRVYSDGTPDTGGAHHGKPSEYFPSKVVSVKGGILNKYLHVENGKHMAAALIPKASQSQLYGKYVIRFKVDGAPGFRTAWLLWPAANGKGEVDYPEGDLNRTMHAFQHPVDGSGQDNFDTKTPYVGAWHTTSIEWLPGKITFLLDGKVIGTSTKGIPANPMEWIIQTEACISDAACDTTPGNIQIDWVAVYAPK
jgi:hypothetical protein